MKKVLVVDDEESVLKAVALALRHHGCEVVLAPGGNRCLEQMRQGFAGVVLMDIMMPDLNGWQTIRTLAQENLLQNVLVCMLTARSSPGPESEGMEEFVFDYLPKPFDYPSLIQCVDNAAGYLPT